MKVSLEERVARIEGILEQMDKRLNHLESEIGEIRGEIGGIRDEIGSLFRWTVGLIIGVWATVITLMLPILLKLLGII
jgi:tetrahydromethanopterin S-methyltransferase subunit G